MKSGNEIRFSATWGWWIPAPGEAEPDRDQPENVTPQEEFGFDESSVSVKSVVPLEARIVEPLVNWLKLPFPFPPLSLLPGVRQ